MPNAASRIRGLALAAFATFGVAALAPPALAQADISTRAFTNHAIELYDGPQREHRQIGEVPGAIEVRVDGCRVLWCHIHARHTRGWVFLYALSFGQGPNSIWWPPEERHGPFHPWPFWGDGSPH
jgi:uncharacterized protein YraI